MAYIKYAVVPRSHAETRDETLPGGMGYRTIKTGRTVNYEVAIDLDVEAIVARLGGRAFHSKGKQAKILKGAVRVRIINEKEPA